MVAYVSVSVCVRVSCGTRKGGGLDAIRAALIDVTHRLVQFVGGFRPIDSRRCVPAGVGAGECALK